MKTLREIVLTLAFVLASCSTKENVRYKPIPPEVINSFNEAWRICENPYTKEKKLEGETAKKFGKRFCAEYGPGQYQNPCGGDFYHISCLEDGGCVVLISGETCNKETDYCGRCD